MNEEPIRTARLRSTYSNKDTLNKGTKMATAKKNVNNTNQNKAKNIENGSSYNSESTPDQVNIIEDTSSNFLT